MSELAAALAARIRKDGPLRLDAWMAACNQHYYAHRDPLGAAGDFITAPEVSQMFGEMIGGWLGDIWLRAGAPAPVRLVELGPGRGTLMADAARVLGRVPGFAQACRLSLVETSPVLARAQQQRLEGLWGATWVASLAEVPEDAPLLLVANEFFDALPIRQPLGPAQERAVGLEEGALEKGALGPAGFVPATLPAEPGQPQGEWSPASEALVAALAARMARTGGAALIIDYGHDGSARGDTLQALVRHAPADPFANPGAHDLTAHVDFARLAAAAVPLKVHGPVPQGAFLASLGIEARAEQLRRANPAGAAQLMAALARLTAAGQMGLLFKAMALTAPHWPDPAGFAT